MSYNPGQGHHVGARVPSGIAFFGTDATDPVYMGDSSFIIDDVGGYLEIPNIKVSDGGTVGSQTTPDSLTFATNGDATFGYDLSITGDLTVNGTTTTVNSTVVQIEDPIIILGSGSPGADDNKDRGVSFNWHNGSAAKTGFFGFDDSAGKFTFIPDATISAEVVSGSAGTIVAALEGNATTATTLQTTRTFSLSGEVTATAQNFNGGANVVLNTLLANSAITGQTELNEGPNDADYLLIYDASATELKKISVANFDTGAMDTFTISDGTNTQIVNDGETILFNSGADIFFNVSATNTVNGYINAGAITGTELNASVAGDGLTGGAGSALAVGAGTLIDVTANAVNVDLTEAAAATIANGDYLIFLDGGTTGAASKGSTVDLATLLAGTVTTTGLDSNGSTLEVQVDDSSIELDVSGNVSVKDGGITEAMRARTVSAPSSTGNITTDIVLASGGASGITLTLPTAASGKMVIVKKTDSAAGTVTVARGGSATIDGSTQKILYAQYESMTFVSDGTNWFIV